MSSAWHGLMASTLVRWLNSDQPRENPPPGPPHSSPFPLPTPALPTFQSFTVAPGNSAAQDQTSPKKRWGWSPKLGQQGGTGERKVQRKSREAENMESRKLTRPGEEEAGIVMGQLRAPTGAPLHKCSAEWGVGGLNSRYTHHRSSRQSTGCGRGCPGPGRHCSVHRYLCCT